MPLNLKSTGGGSVSLSPAATAVDVNITVPATAGTLVTTGSLDASIVPYVPAGTGAVSRTLQAKSRDTLHVLDFAGVDPTGAAVSTVGVQKALDYAALTKRILYCGNAVLKIDGPLTVNGPGIIFDTTSYGSANDPGFLVTGTGYTALTFSPGPHTDSNFTVYGTGNAANGVLLPNNFLASFGAIRVYNLAGFGVKMNKVWDSTFDSISVEKCGTSTEYAFSMNDDGDTCNMTHIKRLQVEVSTARAIYISPLSLSCVIDNIHSERQVPAAGINTWTLGGNRCQYNALRLSSTTPENATVLFDGSNTTYVGALVEDGVSTAFNAYSSGTITFINPELQGTTYNNGGQTGTINVVGGAITKLQGELTGHRMFSTKINSLSAGFANNLPENAVYDKCTIGTLSSTSTVSAATFVDCVINTHGNLLEGVTILKGTTVNNVGGTTLSVNYRTLISYNSTINAPVSIDNGVIKAFGTYFGSTIVQNAGGVRSTFDSGCYALGAVTGLGVPGGGTWGRGVWTKNMAPAVGSPKAWVCTVAGTPGTWVSEGNL